MPLGHAPFSQLPRNHENPDALACHGSWTGAFGLMTADPLSDECSRFQRLSAMQMHVHLKWQHFVWRQVLNVAPPRAGTPYPCVEPLLTGHWFLRTLSPSSFLLGSISQNFCWRDYINLVGFIYHDSSNNQTLKCSWSGLLETLGFSAV